MPPAFRPPFPSRTQVKICGLRDPDQALALDALGVDWLGFNFHPGSKRYIAPKDAFPIISKLRHARAVGVFVDLPAEEIERIADTTGIAYAQLHGREGWDVINGLTVPVIKAIPHTRLGDLGGFAEGLRRDGPGVLEYFLVDTQVTPNPAGNRETGVSPELPQAGAHLASAHSFAANGASEKPRPSGEVDTGGNAGFGAGGQTFDWDLLKQNPLPLPYFLAGGLGPENLASALRILGSGSVPPFAVDLNSRVESAPGNKDMAKIRVCLAIVAGM